MHVEIYSDGSSRGNPGPGGYGTIVRYVAPDGQEHIREFSEGFSMTTNNRMELLGAIVGFEALIKPCDVTFTSDSKYVIDAFNENWIDYWKTHDFVKKDMKKVKNRDLWERLLKAVAVHNVKYVWVKGHAGHEYNERCDSLAVKASEGENLVPNVET